MSSPSRKRTLVSSPPIWALTAMMATGSTDPIWRTWTGTSRSSAFAAVTGLAGKAPARPPGALVADVVLLHAIWANNMEMANAALMRNNNDWDSQISGYSTGAGNPTGD